MGQQRHRRTGASQAHRHSEALRPRSHSEGRSAAHQGTDRTADGGHPEQGTTSTASPRMRRWALGTEVGTKHLGDLRRQEGVWRVVRVSSVTFIVNQS